MTKESVGLTILVAAESGHAFSAFMPSYFTIKTFAGSAEGTANLRAGYPPAVAFNALLGTAVALLIGSWVPLLVALGASAILIGFYEYAIQS